MSTTTAISPAYVTGLENEVAELKALLGKAIGHIQDMGDLMEASSRELGCPAEDTGDRRRRHDN